MADILDSFELLAHLLCAENPILSMSSTGKMVSPSKSKQSPFPSPVTALKGKVSRKALQFPPIALKAVLLHAFATGWVGVCC